MAPSLEKFLAQHLGALDSTHPFHATKQQAAAAFQHQGLPTPRQEAYKYTPLASLLTKHFAHSEPTAPGLAPGPGVAEIYRPLAARHLVLLDGQLSTKHLQPAGGQAQILTFQEAYRQQHPAFLAHFARHAQSKADALVALNTALFETGTFIHIPANTSVATPLCLHQHTAASAAHTITHPRLLVVAGQHSQAHIITTWHTTGLANAVAEVALETGARLDYYTLQTAMGPQHVQLNTTQCHQAARSLLNTYTFTWTGALVRNNLNHVINAGHTETNMYGLYCLHGQQHVDNCTTVDHCQPHTTSRELYKGLLRDAATGVFNGRIYVRPAAQKTNALQTNNNLVLSDQATLHTKPQLEIWADDVKCSHGATTGQLDAAQLFYLQTRGLPAAMAGALLRQAFAHEVIDKVPLEALRTVLQTSWAAQDGSTAA